MKMEKKKKKPISTGDLSEALDVIAEDLGIEVSDVERFVRRGGSSDEVFRGEKR